MSPRKKRKITFEQNELGTYLKSAPRSSLQVNRIHESDCEIVKLNPHLYLSTSVDSFADEWAVGLFKEVETLARVCVHGTLSDLVVSGATPTGFLFSPQWAFSDDHVIKTKVFETVIKELKRAKVPLLGGDEGQASLLNLTGVAIGTSVIKPKTRLGMRPGQLLCTLGTFGVGPALGFQYLLGKKPSELTESKYRPYAQTKAIPSLLKYAKATMDSSDGFCTTLHILSQLNDVKFEMDFDSVRIEPVAQRFCKVNSLPVLSLWYGEIGDYQPIFTIDPEDFSKMKRALPSLLKVGRVLPKKSRKHILNFNGKAREFKPGHFANLAKTTMPEIKSAFRLLIGFLQDEGF